MQRMKTVPMDEALYRYVTAHTRVLHPVLPRLIEETAHLPDSQMQIAPDQGVFMHVLAKLIGARRCLEVGCYTGYSAIAVALALPVSGKLISLDISREYTDIARRFWQEAGVADRIELRLAPAAETLPQLLVEYGVGSFDMMFIDADKENILAYYEHGLQLVRSGGLILIDNVIWSGRVVDARDQSPGTVAIRGINDFVFADGRVDCVLTTISDGIFVVRKR
jgi:caffeoyl-CoA O-methyltransferase